jgi:hypothetical protein
MNNIEFLADEIIINNKYKIVIESELLIDNNNGLNANITSQVTYVVYEINELKELTYKAYYLSLKDAVDFCKEIDE